MGNEQPRPVARASKTHVDVASLKAKIHLQLMRDRKNAEIIKGEKQLVQKLKSKSRNKTQQILIIQRVVNGLKYAAACNQLIAYATTIRAQAQFIADNIGNHQKLEPWLSYVYSLLYAADHLGLSSLTEFKGAMGALNNPTAVPKYVNPQIMSLLSPQPTPEELNIYVLEMSQRNGISLQEINLAGHHFTKQINQIPSSSIQNQHFKQLQKQFALQFQKKLQGNQQPKFPNQFNQGYGNQAGFGFNQNIPNGYINQGYIPQNNQQGYIPQNNQQGYIPPNNQQLKPQSNPYKGLSNLHHAPDFHQGLNVQPNKNQEKPRQFSSFQSIIGKPDNENKMDPIYPSINFDQKQHQPYNPYPQQKPQEKIQQPKQISSPTISQILRDFQSK